ncbi:putative GTP-binding protein 6 [Crassostrea virginica]
MFSRSLRSFCQICKKSYASRQWTVSSHNCTAKNIVHPILNHQTCILENTLKSLFVPLCSFSTTELLHKGKGEGTIHEGDEEEEDNGEYKSHDISQILDGDVLCESDEYKQVLQEEFHYDGSHHSLLVIHPAIRWGPEKPLLTTPELQLSEACALVHSLPKWRVADTKIIKVKSHQNFIFMKGQFEELTTQVKSYTNISAVFVNVDILKVNQVAMLQGAWQYPVFDRYTLVLHIFKEYAKSREAKLQIALAEIPYIRGRLEQINEGGHDHLTGKTHYIVSGGFRFTYIQKRHALISERERRLKGELEKVRQQREILRHNRIKLHFPTVAVVGYTNCGKTTLIKALSEDDSLTPEDRLFATLDVTVHQALLKNLKVLLFDTVGFISNIPSCLMEAFSATLEDALIADVILHVRDSSHPDFVNQDENVISILEKLLPEEKLKNILVVNNKCDLLRRDIIDELSSNLNISAVMGTGLDALKDRLEQAIIKNTGRMKKTFRIPAVGGEHLSWLYKNSTVLSITDGEDGQSYLVETIIDTAAYGKFKHLFSVNKRKH